MTQVTIENETDRAVLGGIGVLHYGRNERGNWELCRVQDTDRLVLLLVQTLTLGLKQAYVCKQVLDADADSGKLVKPDWQARLETVLITSASNRRSLPEGRQ